MHDRAPPINFHYLQPRGNRAFKNLMPLLFVWIVFFVASCLHNRTAIALETYYAVKEQIISPQGWIRHSRAPPDHMLALRIALAQSNFGELERHLYEVSDPDHERYGQHLSKEEVETLVAPCSETLDAVNSWLLSLNITEDSVSRSPARDWIRIRVPVKMAEIMLDTNYYIWEHIASGEYLVRTTAYSLPLALHNHVDLVQPTTVFSRFKQHRSSIFKAVPMVYPPDTIDASEKVDGDSNRPEELRLADASCNHAITIKCLQQLYNVSNFKPSGKGNSSIAVTGYLEQYANIKDLQQFYADQRPDAVNSSFRFVSVNGGKNDQSRPQAGDEANLDAQFAFGLSHPIPATFYSTAGRPPFHPDEDTMSDTNEPYSEWLDFMLTQPNPPLTISTSYGDDEQTVPESLALRVCKGFAQLGARGVTLIFSSGDFGVGDGNMDPDSQTCISNDGRNKTMFLPQFPASCPFVTSVGGTTHIPEVAVYTYFSGGGFSNYFSRPSYQNQTVHSFLSTLPNGTYKGLFHRRGRGIPDVSAQADLFKVYRDGRAWLIGGTSAASPTFAGLVAMLNDARLEAGKPPLGFLNPFLYSRGFQGLNDITIGHNGGCGTWGFNASRGWDPVTGLGTPNFGKLKRLVLEYSAENLPT